MAHVDLYRIDWIREVQILVGHASADAEPVEDLHGICTTSPHEFAACPFNDGPELPFEEIELRA